jgi:ABC-2 type transport system permease protein
VSRAVPLTYALVIVRSIVLKGAGFEMLAGDVLALGLFGLAVLGLAAIRFRKRLD